MTSLSAAPRPKVDDIGSDVVLGIAAGETLCGMRGYKAIAEWQKTLAQGARTLWLPPHRKTLHRSQ